MFGRFAFLALVFVSLACKPSQSITKDDATASIDLEIDPELMAFLKAQDIPEENLREILAQEAINKNPNKGLWVLGPQAVLSHSGISLEEIDAVLESVKNDQKRIAAAIAVGALGAATLFLIPGGQGIGIFLIKAGVVIGAGTIVTQAGKSGVNSYRAVALQKKDESSFKDSIKEGLNSMLGTDTAGVLIGKVEKLSLDQRNGISDFSTNGDYYFQVRNHKYAGPYFETYRPTLSNPITSGLSHPTKSGHILSLISGNLTQSSVYLRRFNSLALAAEGEVSAKDVTLESVKNLLVDTGALLTDIKVLIGRNFRDARPLDFAKYTELTSAIESRKSQLWLEAQGTSNLKDTYSKSLKVLGEAGVLRRQAMNF